MFERFTEGARRAIDVAHDEARALNHNFVGTEHLLLGLLHDDDHLAARVLNSLGLSLDKARSSVARVVGEVEDQDVSPGQLPFTPRSKRVLELALKEALTLGHNRIGTAHLLLGLAREREGMAARILLDFGADAERIRNEVVRALAQGWTPSSQRPHPRPRRPRARRWMYRVEALPDGRLDVDWLDERGAGGWELIGVVGNQAVFKRPQ